MLVGSRVGLPSRRQRVLLAQRVASHANTPSMFPRAGSSPAVAASGMIRTVGLATNIATVIGGIILLVSIGRARLLCRSSEVALDHSHVLEYH